MDWGWDPDTFTSVFTVVAACSTAVLAFFTWRLASRTTDLAQQTSKDVEAQWVPIIVPAIDGSVNADASGRWYIEVLNAGKGPAMQIIAFDTQSESKRQFGPTSGPFVLAAGGLVRMSMAGLGGRTESGSPAGGGFVPKPGHGVGSSTGFSLSVSGSGTVKITCPAHPSSL